MLGELITSKTRLRLLIKFFVSQANRGYLNGLANEMGESTNAIRKELNHLHGAGYLEKIKLYNKVETIFLMSDVENQIISSRFVKEIAQHNGDLKKFTTKSTIKSLKEVYA